MSSMRLLIADGQELSRLGFRKFFEGTELDVVAEAATCREIIEALWSHRPDVVLLSVRMADGCGFSMLNRIKEEFPDLPVVMTTDQDHPAHFARAHALNAAAYLPKNVSLDDFLENIRSAANGGMFWTRNRLRRVTGIMTTPRLENDLEAPLTPRELEVLKALTAGQTNRGIAEQLGISYETVKEHVQHVLKKVGVEDRTQAAVWAVRKDLA